MEVKYLMYQGAVELYDETGKKIETLRCIDIGAEQTDVEECDEQTLLKLALENDFLLGRYFIKKDSPMEVSFYLLKRDYVVPKVPDDLYRLENGKIPHFKKSLT